MLAQTTRPPLGAWRSALQCVRQPRPILFQRTMATVTKTVAPTPAKRPASRLKAKARARAQAQAKAKAEMTLPKPYIHTRKPPNPALKPRAAFYVYPGITSARKTTPAPLDAYHAQQIRRLDPKGLRTRLFSKSNPDSAKPGDVLQVTTRRGEPFAGVCLSIRRAGVDTSICLRNHLTKVGVEMWYKIYSPNIMGIDIVWRRPKRARRARLTYMRKPKHDMGNVDHLVTAWRRTRNVFKSKGSGTANTAAAKAGKGGKKK